MKEIFDLFRNVLAPESSWGTFTRKVLGVLLCLSVGAYGWNLYNRTKPKQGGERPVSVVISTSNSREKAVRDLLNAILRSDPNIKSIWVYSWPDARQLIPVMTIGDNTDPLPGGSFVRGDEEALGSFLFGECYSLRRQTVNTTCPISGFEDSWGIIYVRYADGTSQEHVTSRLGIIEAASRRVGLILYSNASHLGNLRD